MHASMLPLRIRRPLTSTHPSLQDGADGPCWVRSSEPYGEIQVTHSGARSKYKGLKSYEAYDLLGAVRRVACGCVLLAVRASGVVHWTCL